MHNSGSWYALRCLVLPTEVSELSDVPLSGRSLSRLKLITGTLDMVFMAGNRKLCAGPLDCKLSTVELGLLRVALGVWSLAC